MIKETEIKKFAQDNGYEGAEKTDVQFDGYVVYNPTFSSKGVNFVGYPLVILVKDNDIRLSTEDESLEILKMLYPNDEEDDINSIEIDDDDDDDKQGD